MSKSQRGWIHFNLWESGKALRRAMWSWGILEENDIGMLPERLLFVASEVWLVSEECIENTTSAHYEELYWSLHLYSGEVCKDIWGFPFWFFLKLGKFMPLFTSPWGAFALAAESAGKWKQSTHPCESFPFISLLRGEENLRAVQPGQIT